LSGSVKGQQADSFAPALPPLSGERNIFSEEQEMESGRIRAAHPEQNFKIIEDPSPVTSEWSLAFHERRRGLGIGE
jgi:hypothetical protein